MTGRNLCRYLRVLETPVEVQNALRRRELPLVMAERVASMNVRVQKAITERIRAGEPAKSVVAEYSPVRDSRHVKVNDAWACFLRGLQRGLRDLDSRVDCVWVRGLMEALNDLTAARDVIDRLITRAQAGIARSGAELTDWAESFRAIRHDPHHQT